MTHALSSTRQVGAAALDSMARVSIEQMNEACQELDGIDELLGHAIEQLMAAFRRIGERAADEAIAQAVREAVTALQFRDLVGQKLGHMRAELAALGATLQAIRALPAQPGQEDLAARVEVLLRGLRETRSASPARQELMHAGEAEMF
jgi:hypothetical protein